mgnify:CR=1 FL=1
MKKLILASALVATAISGLVQAKDYPQNPVVRPLTLTDGTIQIVGAYSYGKQHDDDTAAGFGGNISYGLTDNLQIGFEGLTYSVLKQKSSGFELAANIGLRGHHDSDSDNVGESLGMGASLFGKQIINDNLAFTFGAGFTHWKEDHLDNKQEFSYTLGAMTNIAKNVTLTAHYTFRDLKDFQQDSANVVNLGLNYALSSNFDIGAAITYSDFEEMEDGVPFHERAEKSATIYAAYRF